MWLRPPGIGVLCLAELPPGQARRAGLEPATSPSQITDDPRPDRRLRERYSVVECRGRVTGNEAGVCTTGTGVFCHKGQPMVIHPAPRPIPRTRCPDDSAPGTVATTGFRRVARTAYRVAEVASESLLSAIRPLPLRRSCASRFGFRRTLLSGLIHVPAGLAAGRLRGRAAGSAAYAVRPAWSSSLGGRIADGAGAAGSGPASAAFAELPPAAPD